MKKIILYCICVDDNICIYVDIIYDYDFHLILNTKFLKNFDETISHYFLYLLFLSCYIFFYVIFNLITFIFRFIICIKYHRIYFIVF